MKQLMNNTVYKTALGALSSACTFLFSHAAFAVDLSQTPLFLAQPAAPIVMLAMSADNELFKKAYNDYSNLDGGSLTIADTTFRSDFEYYGYFDPDWCYTYQDNGSSKDHYFTPQYQSSDRECRNTGDIDKRGAWSGNFLNWATMTRMDIVRQVLYGGKRGLDTKTRTILERAYLPKDIHAFAKVYKGHDLYKYTPFTNNEISFCNVSTGNDGHPELRIARGVWRQWAASEGTQCQWGDGTGTRPDNQTGNGDWYKDSLGEATVRVEVCRDDKDATTAERCKAYEYVENSQTKTSFKPVGVLQVHGESGQIKFGLVTGSYKANLKGGVMRKAARRFAGNTDSALDEVNLETGQFNNVDGIVKNINALRIAGYSFSSSRYVDCDTYSIPISTVMANGRATNRACSDWGNPLAEIYLEALRYITGASAPTTAFNVDDSTPNSNTDSRFPGISDLTSAGNSWTDPMAADEWCANCAVILLSTGANSFDGDDLGGASSLTGVSAVGDTTPGAVNINDLTDMVGKIEFGNNFSSLEFFDGATGHCSANSNLNGLSEVLGICPELPALQGTYKSAGLAYYARTQDIRSDRNDVQSIKTYAIDLAESLPSFSVPVGNSSLTFLPACESQKSGDPYQSCTLIDVEVEALNFDGNDNLVSGSYLIYWEDSLWGFDHDFDGAQRLEFCVGSACTVNNGDPAVGMNQVRITNTVPYANAGNNLRFSYTVTGSGNDGMNNSWAVRPGGTNYDALDNPSQIPSNVGSTKTNYNIGNSSAILLKKPLYYVAKYGGFDDQDKDGTPNNTDGSSSEWDAENNITGNLTPDGLPDNYFGVSNPAQLEASLNKVFASVIDDIASGSAASANSTRLTAGSVVYQAKFSSADWSGELIANSLNPDTGEIVGQKWTSAKVIDASSRKIYSTNFDYGFEFNDHNWDELHAYQKYSLSRNDENEGKRLMRWVRGETDIVNDAGNLLNGVAGTSYRDRNHKRWLGDIVNSDPVHAGKTSYGFQKLPDALGGNEYAAYINGGTTEYPAGKKERAEVVYVNANDGMLHAFDAENGNELWAYVPGMVYEKFKNLARENYGDSNNAHKYLVDGPIFVGDAFISHGNVNNKSWRNILVGTYGGGSRGLFVLDVTDPANVTASSLVKFEITEYSYPEIGNVLARPVIAPVGDSWKIVLGNGYNSNGGDPQLLVIDLDNPRSRDQNNSPSSAIRAINSNNDGLAEPALMTNSSGVVVSAYAGDLNGRMWKFDLDGFQADQWGLDYRLYTAQNNDGEAQPITSSPILGLNKELNNATMVYFGTGSYMELADNNDKSVQSFYAIADKGSSIATTYSGANRNGNLYEKTIATEANKARTIAGEWTTSGGTTSSSIDWSTVDGWFIDFVQPNGTKQGERIISKPLLVFDRLIFPTVIPSNAACEFGGDGWIMELVGVGDKYVNHSVLGQSGLQQDNAVLGLSALIRSGENAYLPVSDIRGNLDMQAGTLPPGTYGRMSWRQVQ
ncbi:Type IV pilus biogenesis factor PilY1 [Thalassocella blandensis]|nr:Type IV pilus biogenesis factor PilY1 [Thalassocella blandensis]